MAVNLEQVLLYKYVLTEITSILPKSILDNVVVVFSNTADPQRC